MRTIKGEYGEKRMGPGEKKKERIERGEGNKE